MADLEIERLKNHALAERLGDPLGIEYERRATLGGKGDVDLVRVKRRCRRALQAFPLRGQLAPHVLGSRGDLGVLPCPLCELLGARLELTELSLLQLAQLHASFQPGTFLRDVGGVIAIVALNAALL